MIGTLPRSLLVDSNLLVLFVVGAYDRNLIARFKRTAQFEPDDYDRLVDAMGQFQTVLVTPHVLTETSNLIGQLNDPARTGVRTRLYALLELTTEQHVAARDTAETSFVKFGLTDAAIEQVSDASPAVLTDDHVLAGYLKSRGVHAFNFNHLRSADMLDVLSTRRVVMDT